MGQDTPRPGLLRRVIVVLKVSSYQQAVVEGKDENAIRLMAEENPAVLDWAMADRQHKETVAFVEKLLKAKGIECVCVRRDAFVPEVANTYDLVVTVGGDGTFLTAAHGLNSTRLLGVNSSVTTSHGHWCLAHKDNFEDIIDAIDGGSLQPISIMRLVLVHNGKTLPIHIINEVFVSHCNPAGTSRFILEMDGKREDIRSSGLLAGPGAGSTGWMRSAGGVVLPATSQQFQFLVREPSIRRGEKFQMLKGLLERGQELKVFITMDQGKMYIDGQHITFDVARGDELIIKACPQDLNAFLSPEANEGYPTTTYHGDVLNGKSLTPPGYGC